jgi:hypothetical protein
MWMIQMLPRAGAVKDLRKILTSLDCSKPSRLHPIGRSPSRSNLARLLPRADADPKDCNCLGIAVLILMPFEERLHVFC